MIGTATVLVAMLASFRTLKARAELNAYDGLTGLQNRRSTYDALASRADQARYRAKVAGRDRIALTSELAG